MIGNNRQIGLLILLGIGLVLLNEARKEYHPKMPGLSTPVLQSVSSFLTRGREREAAKPKTPTTSLFLTSPRTSSLPVFDELRSCLVKLFRPPYSHAKDLVAFKELTKAVRNCTGTYLISNLDSGLLARFESFKMGRFGESKYFLKPNSVKKIEKCYFLTIGIGNDYNVEKEFKTKVKRYPHCQIFGIEPMPEQFEHFDEYGTVINEAVGLVAGKTTLTIRLGTDNAKARYVPREMPVVPLHQLSDKYMQGTRFIQYATMDIEGFEYKLLRGLFHGGEMSREGIVICQIDVELHDIRPSFMAATPFSSFLHDLFTNSSYLPMKADNFGTHRKLTLVDVVDPRCNQLFGVASISRRQQPHDNSPVLLAEN